MKRNIIKCRICETIIESTHCHHWVKCECGAIFTDGGTDYCRRGGERENFVKPTPEEIKEFDALNENKR